MTIMATLYGIANAMSTDRNIITITIYPAKKRQSEKPHTVCLGRYSVIRTTDEVIYAKKDNAI